MSPQATPPWVSLAKELIAARRAARKERRATGQVQPETNHRIHEITARAAAALAIDDAKQSATRSRA